MRDILRLACRLGFLTGLFLTANLAAQVNFTGVYSENFDGLSTSSNPFTSTNGDQKAIPGVANWSATKIGGTDGSAPAVGSTDGYRKISEGLASLGSTSSSDRALGTHGYSAVIMAFGVALTNATTATIDTVTIAFTAEFWRSSTRDQETFTFGYGTGSSTLLATNALTSTAMLADARLNLSGPAPASTSSSLNGNLSANQATYAFTLTGLNWTASEPLYLRWSDTAGGAASGHMFGIDDFSLATSAIPEPGTGALLAGLGALGFAGLRRRRRD